MHLHFNFCSYLYNTPFFAELTSANTAKKLNSMMVKNTIFSKK